MRPQNGKQKFLLAAINLFESQGYFATTIDQIAVEAGVSKGLVYHYFKSKEMLLETLFIETTNTMESVAIVLDSHNAIEDSWSQFIDNFSTI